MDFERLIQLPESSRDDRWELQFLDAIVSGKVEVQGDGAPVHGPDGWPYLSVKTAEGDEPFVRVVTWLAGQGMGLVVNSHKMAPDYVFTYGMLWNYKETGRFIAPRPAEVEQDTATPGQADLGQRPVQGAPTERYLPSYVRTIMREFLKEQGILEPRILVATSPDYLHTDLVWSLESVGSPNLLDQRSLAETLSWFLPLHYSIVFAPELALKAWVPL